MAGGKETPRQKMIGMMYLVLTALLAMNVSKEIINAFITLNNKMEFQNETFEQSNAAKQASIQSSLATAILEAGYEGMSPGEAYAKALQDNKNSVVKLYRLLEVSESVDSLTRETVSGTIHMADELLQAGAQGTWVGEDSAGYMKILNLNDPENDYGKKDDYDIPTYMMVEQKKGDDLLEMLNAYKKELCTHIASIPIDGKTMDFTPPDVTRETAQDQDYLKQVEASMPDSVNVQRKKAILEVYKVLTLPEKVENHGEMVPWVQGQFDHAPMVAAVAIFTSVKGQVLQAAGVTLNFLASQNDVPPFKFDTIEPKAFAQTGYINSGDSLPLQVGVIAYDSKADIEIRYVVDPQDSTAGPEVMKPLQGGGNKIMLGQEEGSSVGDHYVRGQIAVEENGSKVWKDFDFRYKVGAPTSAIGNAEMNLVYIGYNNRISASGSGYNDVTASCSGCSGWTKDGEDYIARVSSGIRQITVNVTGKDDEGNPVSIGTQTFRVKALPKAKIFPNGYDPFKTTINRSVLARASFKAELFGSPLVLPASVNRMSVTISRGGAAMQPITIQGNVIRGQAREIIQQLPPGSSVTIAAVATVGGNTQNAEVTYRIR